MMAIVEVSGIVTREIKYGDSSRILTVLTKELGKISVLAGGARSNKSGLLAATQLFSYVQFTLFQSRGKGLYKINAGEIITSFGSLREDLGKTAYAAYFCDVANYVIQEDNPDPEQLSLLLNTLYMLNRNGCVPLQIKAVYEFRTLAVQGLLPPVWTCDSCGSDVPTLFVPQKGCVYCDPCGTKSLDSSIHVGTGLLRAIAYITAAEPKKIFSFQLGKDALSYLSQLGDYCLELYLEKHFKTLDYLKNVQALEG